MSWEDDTHTPLTVGKLIEFLKQFPENMPIVEQRYSDLGPMELEDWKKIEAIRMANGDWYQRTDWRFSHKDDPYKLEGRPREAVEVVYFHGN